MADIDTTKPDPRISNILSDIEKCELTSFEDRTFAGNDVHLDGRHFHNCTFQTCRIFVKFGYFALTGTIRFEDCTFDISGPASNVNSIFNMLAQQES